MEWGAVILAAFKALAAAVDYLQRKQLLDAAQAEIYGRYAKGALDEIRIANEARAAVRDDYVRHSERVSDTDGFRRD